MTDLVWSMFILVILACAIIVISFYIIFNKDKKDQQDYINYLKKQNSKLKYNQDGVSIPCKNSGIQLFKETIEYISIKFRSKFGHDIVEDKKFYKTDSVIEKEKTIMITGYKTLIAELNGLENSQEPSEIWHKIQKCLSILTGDNINEINLNDMPEQLRIAKQRITNLEKFKALYFELQEKMSASINFGETINAEIIENIHEKASSEQLIKLLEKHNTHYIEMGKMTDMDKESHHFSVQYLESYTDHYLNERKSEIKRLKTQVSQQFEEIWKLQTILSQQNGTALTENKYDTINHAMAQQLKDAELCIETMDMEIQSLASELSNMKNRPLNELKDKYTQLENKHTQLEANYANMENKYLEAIN